MERLTILLALTLLFSLSSVAEGQAVRFTIAGDVVNPRTLALSDFDPDQTVYLNDLLEKAGAQGEGNAVILRGDGHQGEGSEFVSAQIAGRGPQLTNGDIVVYHEVFETVEAAKHVLVIVDAVPRVVLLADSGNRMGSLLAIFNLVTPADTLIPVVRTRRGSAVRRQLTPSEALVHGDVVLLNTVAEVDASHVSRLFGTVAEIETIEPSNSTIQTGFDEPPSDALTSGSESGGIIIPIAETNYSRSAADASQVSIGQAVVETSVSAETVRPAPAVVDVLPDGDALAYGAAATGMLPVWNGVFIFGVLGSMALILTGWLKTHRESSPSQSHVAGPKNRLQPPQEIPDPATSIRTPRSVDDEVQSASLTSKVATSSGSQTAMAAQPADTVIAATDWPVLPQGLVFLADADRVVSEQQSFGGNWGADSATISTPDTQCDFPEPAEEPEPRPLAFSETSDNHLTATATANESAQQNAEMPVTTADDLENLIQNRLPVELQQADLPLRVTLFGHPAGPRRLRIDAAHIQVAAPKFTVEDRFHRESPPKVTNVPASQEKEDQDAASLDRALNSLHEQGH